MYWLIAPALAFPSFTTLVDPAPDYTYSTPEDVKIGDTVVGDFDGDGYDDLALPRLGRILEPDLGITVFYGGPTGLPPEPQLSWIMDLRPQDEWFEAALAVADVTGDGLDDLVVGLPGDGSPNGPGRVEVHEGSPLGLSSTASASVDGEHTNLGFALRAAGDLDLDGYEDVLVGDVNSWDTVWEWFRGSPAGLEPTGLRIKAIHIVGTDLTGDGFGDIVTTDYDTEDILLFVGGPAGPEALPHLLQLGSSNPIAAADVTGDGIDEIALYLRDIPSETASVEWSSLSESYELLPVLIQPAPYIGRLDGLPDLDGDLFEEWAVASVYDEAWLVEGADQTGVLQYTVSSSEYLELTSEGSTSAGDFDGDGCMDLLQHFEVVWHIASNPYGGVHDADSLVGTWSCPMPQVELPTTPQDTPVTTGHTGGPEAEEPEETQPSPPDEKEGCGCNGGSSPFRPGWIVFGLALATRSRQRNICLARP